MICEAIGWDYHHADKVDHAAGGALIGAIDILALNHLDAHDTAPVRAVLALLPVVLVGIAKEVRDNQHRDKHTPDWKDAAATVAGGMVGVGLCLRW